MIFKFFDKQKPLNKDSDLLNVACLMIHAARIDENYTEKEREIIKKTLTKLDDNEDQSHSNHDNETQGDNQDIEDENNDSQTTETEDVDSSIDEVDAIDDVEYETSEVDDTSVQEEIDIDREFFEQDFADALK